MAERLKFDRALYLPEAVEAAAAAYAGYAGVEVTKGEESCEAVLTALGGRDEKELAHGFCNHALYETITRQRQAALQGGAQ